MMDASRGELLNTLKVAEGLRLKPYTDTVGKLTIGYGRNLTDNGINQEEANSMLELDLDRTWSQLQQAMPWVASLDETRQMVLAEMAFNLGVATLATFTKTLLAVQQGAYGVAAEDMLQSKWASQVGARATRLASAMSSGEWK